MAVFQRGTFKQCVPIFIAKMGNIDHRERIIRLNDKFGPGLSFGKQLAGTQNRQWAAQPTQIKHFRTAGGHSVAQSFQNGFFFSGSGACCGAKASGFIDGTGTDAVVMPAAGCVVFDAIAVCPAVTGACC